MGYRIYLIIVVVLAIAAQPSMARTVQPAQPSITTTLALSPTSQRVLLDEVFTLDIQADLGTATADTLDVYIDFDPALVQLVDAAGTSASSIVVNPALGANATINQASNQSGTIDLSLSKFRAPFFAGTFSVATLRFRALAEASSMALRFVRTGARTTDLLSGGASLAPTLTDATAMITQRPTITMLAPASRPVGSSAFTLVVTGTGFSANSIVRWNGDERTTQFSNTTTLAAAIPASDLTTSGSATITVANPGDVVSNAQSFMIVPRPERIKLSLDPVTATVQVGDIITLMLRLELGATSADTVDSYLNFDPAVLTAVDSKGDPATSVEVRTDNFPSASFNAIDNATGRIDLSLSDVRAPFPTGTMSLGTLRFKATRAVTTTTISFVQQGARTTDVLRSGASLEPMLTDASLTITTLPAPTLRAVTPMTITRGSDVRTLTVDGTNFTDRCVVQWNGADRETTYTSVTRLIATLGMSDTDALGTADVGVVCPTGSTATRQIMIVAPMPTLTSIDPVTRVAGSGPFILTLTGSGFIDGSTVRWNGENRATTFVSDTELRAAISAADVANVGDVRITVVNLAPGGGTSNALSLAITDDDVVPCNADALIAAIERANTDRSPDTIELYEDCTYTLTTPASGDGVDLNGLPIITSDITLDGNGATITRASNAPAFRLVTVARHGILTLHDLTLSRGRTGGDTAGQSPANIDGGDGGAIFNSGVLTMTDSVVAGNATGWAYVPNRAGNGGGIFNEGIAFLANTVVRGNMTNNLEGDTFLRGTAGNGGGIFSSGTLTITNTVLTENIAGNGYSLDQYPGSDGGSGGGIYIALGGRALITESSIRGNTAGRGGYGTQGGDGGDGGGISTRGALTLLNTTVAHNSAGAGGSGGSSGAGGLGGFGGGLFATGDAAISVINSTFLHNSSGRGGVGGSGRFGGNAFGSGGPGGSGGYGGGIALIGATGVTLTNTTVVSNVTGLGGNGGSTQVVPGVPSGTPGEGGAGGHGGGIYNTSSVVTILNTTLAYNATQGGGQSGDGNTTGASGNGGGISSADCRSVPCDATTTLMLTNSLIVENQVAENGTGANCSGVAVTDGRGNLSWSDATCPGLNADPRLGLFGDHGGPTQTLALLPGSPAIDAGYDEVCPATDQRGVRRLQGIRCDSGAYELVYTMSRVFLPFVRR